MVSVLILVLGSIAGWAEPESSRLPAVEFPPVQLGNTTVSIPFPTLQTGLRQDLSGTIFLVTALSNGDKQILRVSKRHAIKKLMLYNGWPYVLTTRGRVFAMDVAFRTSFRNKLPAIGKRVVRLIPYAAAGGAGAAVLSLVNLWMHGGSPETQSTAQPIVFGLSGISAVYLTDWFATIFLRSHRALGHGGNFFKTKLAERVADVVADKERNDFRIEFKDKKAAPVYLSALVPSYTADSSCIYALTRLTME